MYIPIGYFTPCPIKKKQKAIEVAKLIWIAPSAIALERGRTKATASASAATVANPTEKQVAMRMERKNDHASGPERLRLTQPVNHAIQLKRQIVFSEHRCGAEMARTNHRLHCNGQSDGLDKHWPGGVALHSVR
jgi:hypothetical protein